MVYTVSSELYRRYRDEVVRLSLFKVQYDGYSVSSGLSDEAIAQCLGLSVRDVIEIRCVAEIDLLPLSAWEDADRFKEENTRKLFEARLHKP